MSNIPKITINIESGCYTCHKPLNIPVAIGGCGCGSSPIVYEDNTPNSPCDTCNDVCEDVLPSDCILMAFDDIPQFAFTKGDKLTKVIITFAAEILALKTRVLDLEARVTELEA